MSKYNIQLSFLPSPQDSFEIVLNRSFQTDDVRQDENIHLIFLGRVLVRLHRYKKEIIVSGRCVYSAV